MGDPLSWAARIADKYISPADGSPQAEAKPSRPSPGTILEQMIADMELLVIHGNDLDGCETCDVWLTMDEAVRTGDVTLCPYQAYGGPKFPNEPCYRDRPWRHVHRHGFDKAEAARRTDELMKAARAAGPAPGGDGL